MALIPVIQTQLVPPRVKNCIQRKRLRNLGYSIISHHVTSVIAPAGYGKSVWISSLLKEPDWPPTAWLSLDRHNSEPSSLLYHLVHAIKKVLPEFGTQSLRTMNSLEDVGRDWLITVSTLIEEIPQEHEIVLVLDDFHLIDQNSTVCNILEYLARWLPAGIHLVLISRNSLPLNLYREQFSGELLEVRSDQLLFSVEEARELIFLLGLEPGEKDINMIHQCTEGWPVVLRLLGMYLKQSGGDIKEILSALKQKDADLYTYLSNELLDSLPNELHNFLLDSSLLPYLQSELCNAALQCIDSDTNIRHLHSLGILSRITGETMTWRLHHLMGEFLEQKVMRLRPPDYIVSVRRRAAAFLEHKRDIDRALEQVAACADWHTAVGLIHAHGDKYFLESGRLDALHSWICRLPEKIVSCDYWILYFKGMSILHIHPEQALDTLSWAADFAGKKGDIKCQLRSLLAMIAAYTFENNVNKINETANRIPVAASLLKNSWSRGVVLVAALSRAAWGDNLRQGVWLSWLASKAKLDPESRMAYFMFTSIIQYRLGNLSSAKELIEKALTDPYVQENERWTGTAYVIYAIICFLSGEHQKVMDICKELLRLGQKYNAPHQLGNAHRRLAHLHLKEGLLDEARKEFELSRNAYSQANNIFFVYLIDIDLFLLRVKAGENARDLLPETQYILDKLNAFPGGQGLDEYALSVAGIIAMEAGQLELAQQRFEEVSLRCKRKGSRKILAGTQLFLAKIALLHGDNSTADSYLCKALASAETDKWEYFWDWHHETVYSLCQRALIKKIHPRWAVHLLQRWFPERFRKEAGSLLVYPDESVKNSIALLLKNLIQETGVPIVHINCLGGFRAFINGVEIPSSLWKTRKAENLFKLLIIDRHQHLKERIIEELWPESGPKSGDANLRMALTHVRKALGLKGLTDESVILKRGMVYLNPEIEIYTDYELFTSLAQSTLEDTNTDNPVILTVLEQAAGHYKGDFLPDNLYDDWTTDMRTQLQHLYLQVLLKQVECYQRQGKLVYAIQACRNYLALEPSDETVGRAAMELLWQSGQKQQALSLYQELSTALAKEYDVIPAAATTQLYEEIRCG